MVEFEELSDEEDAVDPSVYAAKILPADAAPPPVSGAQQKWSDPQPPPSFEPGEKNAAAALAAKEDGNSYFRAKEYDLAIEYYSQAILLCPEDPPVLSDEEEEKDEKVPPSPPAHLDDDAAPETETQTQTPAAKAAKYTPPTANAEMLAMFLSNRAACFSALSEWDMVVDDCNWALDLHAR